MAQNKRAVSKIEFNKRIRDLVSRDSNRLRQTFQKFDKECATRLAEIQSMQEKVRYSMRNLKQEKMQAQLNAVHDLQLERRGNESLPHQESAFDRKAFTPEERRKNNYRASIPGIPYNRFDHLEVPSSGQTRSRRHSLPHRPTFLSGSPKEIRTQPRASISSSLPKETIVKPATATETPILSNLSSSPKESSHLSHLQLRKNGYRLSISDLPILPPRFDNVSSIRVKRSPQLDRRSLDTNDSWDDQSTGMGHVKDEKSSQEICNQDTKNPRRSSHTPSHLNIAMETDPRRESDPNNVKSKPLVKRTRSSSLPFEPETMFGDVKLREIHSCVPRSVTSVNPAAGSKALPITTLPKKENEDATRSFEELRRCRYLRSRSEID